MMEHQCEQLGTWLCSLFSMVRLSPGSGPFLYACWPKLEMVMLTCSDSGVAVVLFKQTRPSCHSL